MQLKLLSTTQFLFFGIEMVQISVIVLKFFFISVKLS